MAAAGACIEPDMHRMEPTSRCLDVQTAPHTCGAVLAGTGVAGEAEAGVAAEVEGAPAAGLGAALAAGF